MNNKTPLVSIVIPIYNVEKYLEECLDSIIDQDYENLEIICVNDGSTDSSLEIIRTYEAKDNRIKVIDKPNGGYGHAVNRGLEEATGHWLSIIEPDDIIDHRMYKDLVALADTFDVEPDIVKSSYWLYFALEDGSAPYVQRPNIMNCMPQGICTLDVWKDPEVLRHHPSIWSAIYRLDFINEHSIRMIEPKGAGWADNPWFFETMLQAKSIVWTPGAYYYYRQTNPDASSKLKSYLVPFDRLRDIRAIYERFGIGEEYPELLGVLYQRSFNYICASILDEFGFPENDPELQALIREVFESFDENIMRKSKLISKRHKGYYDDFMGIRMSKITPVARPENPMFSFVVPLFNDERGLWETVTSLRKQYFANWEAILVDCASQDRSIDIAEQLSAIDKRFTAVIRAEDIPSGFNLGLQHARGTYVHFIRPGVNFDVKNNLSQIAKNLERLDEVPDYFVFKTWFPASRLVPRNTKIKAVCFNTVGIEGDVALAAYPHVYSRLFSRSFLLQQGIEFFDSRDTDGLGFCVETAVKARKAAFVAARDVNVYTRSEFDRRALHDEQEMTEYALGRYDAIAQTAERVGTAEAWRVARSCIIVHLAIDVAKIGRARSGEKYYEALKNVFLNGYGIHEAPVSDFANYLDFGVLDEAFRLSYEDYAHNLLGRQSQTIIDLSWHIDQRNRRIEAIERSGSYKVGKKIGSAAKTALPKNAVRKFVKTLK